ncbi:hypothetical protein AHMF7616_05341 [Adhaeribacter pallidiroseus]|uniref:Uncharacterized protein n=1 Tax=Adhaeribacter pallidiroseus TaxID=2072847 RepID=A0A369Q5Y4_9BACT|nr:hypothetical protein AHMF7616_05341 [Adhaeribacter pallidiroseus]
MLLNINKLLTLLMYNNLFILLNINKLLTLLIRKFVFK